MTSTTTIMEKDDHQSLLQAKQLVLDYHKDLDECHVDQLYSILNQYTATNTTKSDSDRGGSTTTATDFVFRSVYPFRDFLTSKAEIVDTFWMPLKTSFTHLRRRTDLFFGGKNMLHHEGNDNDNTDNDDDNTFWIVSMGHFVGLLDQDWLGIRATRQMANLRFAEFTQVDRATNKIQQQSLFLDVIGLMESLGYHPLPQSTGTYFQYPGPASGNGLALARANAPPVEGQKTQELVDRMVDDLTAINHLMTPCPPDILRKTWHEDMVWYGPAGIGASMTIPRYQEQHQYPFRQQVSNKKFAGHVARVAEGDFAAFFGWPHNLTNTPIGGFLGLPGCGAGGNETPCPMQVVDVYRREGDKLAENWVFIDIPWYLKAQGLDILARTTGIVNPVSLSSVSKSTSSNTSPSKSKRSAAFADDKGLPAAKKAAMESAAQVSEASSEE